MRTQSAERFRPTGLLLALVLPLWAGSCSNSDPGRSSPPNLVLIVVDTLRADHLSSYGHTRETSPALDAIAREGVRFEACRSTSSWTMPSVASLITGLPPSTHGAENFQRLLPQEATTLAEVLGGAGYRTAGVVSHTLVGERYGYDQGYGHFSEDEALGSRHISTPGVTERSAEWLRANAGVEKPFFLFAHYFDPHSDYLPHKDFDWAPEQGLGRVRPGMAFETLRMHIDELNDEELDYLTSVYDEEIRLTDRGIGELMELLEEMGVADNTLVVITADHGEEFLDHGWWGHVVALYDEVVRVPLVLRGPGVQPGLVVDQAVSNLSLMPTLLELLDLKPPVGMPAPSLAPLLRGDDFDPGPSFFEVEVDLRKGARGARLQGVVRGNQKLIRDSKTGVLQLFDLSQDPLEKTDLSQIQPESVAELLSLLDDYLSHSKAARLEVQDMELSGDERSELEDLGYIGGDEDQPDDKSKQPSKVK